MSVATWEPAPLIACHDTDVFAIRAKRSRRRDSEEFMLPGVCVSVSVSDSSTPSTSPLSPVASRALGATEWCELQQPRRRASSSSYTLSSHFISTMSGDSGGMHGDDSEIGLYQNLSKRICLPHSQRSGSFDATTIIASQAHSHTFRPLLDKEAALIQSFSQCSIQGSPVSFSPTPEQRAIISNRVIVRSKRPMPVQTLVSSPDAPTSQCDSGSGSVPLMSPTPTSSSLSSLLNTSPLLLSSPINHSPFSALTPTQSPSTATNTVNDRNNNGGVARRARVMSKEERALLFPNRSLQHSPVSSHHSVPGQSFAHAGTGTVELKRPSTGKRRVDSSSTSLSFQNERSTRNSSSQTQQIKRLKEEQRVQRSPSPNTYFTTDAHGNYVPFESANDDDDDENDSGNTGVRQSFRSFDDTQVGMAPLNSPVGGQAVRRRAFSHIAPDDLLASAAAAANVVRNAVGMDHEAELSEAVNAVSLNDSVGAWSRRDTPEILTILHSDDQCLTVPDDDGDDYLPLPSPPKLVFRTSHLRRLHSQPSAASSPTNTNAIASPGTTGNFDDSPVCNLIGRFDELCDTEDNNDDDDDEEEEEDSDSVDERILRRQELSLFRDDLVTGSFSEVVRIGKQIQQSCESSQTQSPSHAYTTLSASSVPPCSPQHAVSVSTSVGADNSVRTSIFNRSQSNSLFVPPSELFLPDLSPTFRRCRSALERPSDSAVRNELLSPSLAARVPVSLHLPSLSDSENGMKDEWPLRRSRSTSLRSRAASRQIAMDASQ